ncbi:hypothetical protein EMPG_14966 [Blastomyces silverae]|uniref:DUF7924 domain-containing protein n=1 Tax=Blastomyces silverae TaxID=2060906 RepID=A0A0H1BEP9_9EURO|nr:hypothetical protein EMPG_14966 [Blastomyces silverae]
MKHLKPLNESVKKGWDSAIPFYGPCSQPDYSVGFGRSAFADDQLEKLKPFVGEAIPPILPCLRGSTGKHLESQRKGFGTVELHWSQDAVDNENALKVMPFGK